MNNQALETTIKNELYVDGNVISFSDEKNLLEVLKKAGIEVPALCYRTDLSIYGACRMCVVEIEGRGVQTSCTTKPEAGMKVKVNTAKVRKIRKMSLELLLANHNRDCTTCEKSGECYLQELSQTLGIKEIRFEKRKEELPLDTSNPSIVRDPNKCILCGACIRACKEVQGQNVLDFSKRGSETLVGPAYGKNLNEVDCVYCGQCISVCPTGALTIKSDIDQVWEAINDKSKLVIVQIAPAVRVAVGESFGFEPGKNTMGLVTSALKQIGIDKVFDTSFAADMTIMEEATELVTRLLKKEKLPLITSCCPAWVRFAEYKYPNLLENLSSCRSPQQMFGSIAKQYLAKKYNVAPEDMVVVSIMPCTAKKAEKARPEFSRHNIDDVDIVITTQELVRLIKEASIDFKKLQPKPLDAPFGVLTGAGVIFGNTGGVAEAAARTAYEMVTGEPLTNVIINEARGLEGFKEIALQIKNDIVKIAIVNGLKNASDLLEKVKAGEVDYDFIEIMACPGGCISGAGQPPNFIDNNIKQQRQKGLYEIDVHMSLHKSNENPVVKNLYKEWLGSPNSHVAHELLHTNYHSRKRISNENFKLVSDDNHMEEQIEVKVCVGTCCYLQGSYNFVEKLIQLIQKNGMEGYVSVNATFCFENCSKAPSISINGQIISGATEDKVNEIFEKYIMKKVTLK